MLKAATSILLLSGEGNSEFWVGEAILWLQHWFDSHPAAFGHVPLSPNSIRESTLKDNFTTLCILLSHSKPPWKELKTNQPTAVIKSLTRLKKELHWVIILQVSKQQGVMRGTTYCVSSFLLSMVSRWATKPISSLILLHVKENRKQQALSLRTVASSTEY